MKKILTFLLAFTVMFSTVSAFAFDPGEHNTFTEIGTWDMSQANDTHSVTLSGTETTVTYENGALVNTIAEGPVLDRITFTGASGTISSGDWAYFELNIDITNISQNDSDRLRWTLRRDGTSVLGNVRISPSVIAVRMRNTSSYTSEKQIISYELNDSERNAPIKIGVLVNKSATTVKLYINGNEKGSVDNYTPYYTTINGSSYISVSHANVVGDSYKILGYRVLKKTGTDLPDSGTVPEEPIGGLTFASDSMYLSEKPIMTPPLTYEASICLPTGYTARAGVIAGNYYYSGNPCVSFEIYNNGVPRIYIVDSSKNTYSYSFSDVNVCTGKFVNLAIAFDTANSKAYCYVDGALKQTLTDVNYPQNIKIGDKIVLGGDMRGSNAQYFKGNIKSLRLYSDMRTEQEISTDFESGLLDKNGLVAAYTIEPNSDDSKPAKITDLSGNGYNFNYNEIWIKNDIPTNEYAYSFAVVGDIQIVNRDYPQYLDGIYDWIIDNADDYNTKFVFGLGDITDKNTDAEWERGEAAIGKLSGVLPYSIVRGNHDTQEQFSKYFTYSEYGNQASGTFDETMLNTYYKFNVGDMKYLALNLDFGAHDDVLSWANQVVSANSDRNVIVVTHGYLYRDGTTLDVNDPGKPTKYDASANNGDDIWNEFIKKHENITMVLCGHIPCESIITSQVTGEKGNTVTQVLIDPQETDVKEGGTGLVAMLHFSEDGKNVQVRYYSTAKKAYFMTDNQCSFTLDVIEPREIKTEKISFENGITLNAKLSGHIRGKVIAVLYDNNYAMIEHKIYDAAATIPVSFTQSVKKGEIKIMWWDGMNTIVPLAECESIEIMTN